MSLSTAPSGRLYSESKRDLFSIVSARERVERRETQVWAEFRKGRRMRTLGRVNPWSAVLREGRGAEVEGRDWEREMWSLFFRTLARDLRRDNIVSLVFQMVSGGIILGRKSALLEHMIHSMQCDSSS